MAKQKLVIAIPDLLGKSQETGFCQSLLDHLRQISVSEWETIILPLLNGRPSARTLDEVARGYPSEFTPLVLNAASVVETLRSGYAYIMTLYREGVLIRIDNAEHPPEYIHRFMRELEHADMVIGDLQYSDVQLNGADLYFQQDFLPLLFRKFARQRLDFSGAHGFQGFTLERLPQIYNLASSIMLRAKHNRGSALKWGFDGAMIYSAVLQELDLKVIPVPAVSVRDRERCKVVAQYRDFLEVGFASLEVERDIKAGKT